MNRGGKRAGAGRPKAVRATTPQVAGRVLEQQKSELLWNEICQTDIAIMRTTGKTAPLREDLKYLEDRAHGKPMDTVNHLHNQPMEMNVNLTLSERFRIAIEKGDKRVRERG